MFVNGYDREETMSFELSTDGPRLMRFPYPVHTAGEIFRAIARGDGEIVRDLHNR